MNRVFILTGFCGLLCGSLVMGQTTLQVTNNGASSYGIDGIINPTLTLDKGATYIFSISATGHPFWIKTIASTGNGNAYDIGVTNNGTANGDLTFAVPINAPDSLYYNCQFHSPMTGLILTQTPLRLESDGTVPAKYGLRQNFPNPFNPTTTIRFDLPMSVPVTLTIHDLRGNEVAQLVDAEFSAGRHKIQWVARHTASGTYVARLVTPDYTQSIKMVLLK